MMNLELGSLADWVGNVISFFGILVASFFTVRYYRKDNKKHGSYIEILNLRESLQKKAWSM